MSAFSRLASGLRSLPSWAARYLDNRLAAIEDSVAGLSADGTFTMASAAAFKPVYISAANTVALADADASGKKMPIGITVSAPTGSTAVVRFIGLVTGAGSFTAGAPQYVSTTAGALTETPPASPNATPIAIAINTTDLLVLGPLGAVFDTLRSTTANLGASLISIADIGTLITATTVEAALQELAQFKADLGNVANAKGASLVAVEDSATQLTATNVETALAELAAKFAAGLTPAITKLQIATGTLVAGEATISTNIVVTANSYVLAMPTANVTGSTNFGCLSNTRASNSVGSAGVGSVLIRALGSDGAKDADAACSFVALIIN